MGKGSEVTWMHSLEVEADRGSNKSTHRPRRDGKVLFRVIQGHGMMTALPQRLTMKTSKKRLSVASWTHMICRLNMLLMYTATFFEIR